MHNLTQVLTVSTVACRQAVSFKRWAGDAPQMRGATPALTSTARAAPGSPFSAPLTLLALVSLYLWPDVEICTAVAAWRWAE